MKYKKVALWILAVVLWDKCASPYSGSMWNDLLWTEAEVAAPLLAARTLTMFYSCARSAGGRSTIAQQLSCTPPAPPNHTKWCHGDARDVTYAHVTHTHTHQPTLSIQSLSVSSCRLLKSFIHYMDSHHRGRWGGCLTSSPATAGLERAWCTRWLHIHYPPALLW